MKILFSHNIPFFLAHGGTQTLIESLMRELGEIGVEVEPERWWDERQQADILHYVGRPASAINVSLAHQKGWKVVMTENLDQTASRSRATLFAQRLLTRLAQSAIPGLTQRLAWDVYRELDAMVYVVPHEWETARYLFNAVSDRGHVIPHGLEAQALALLSKPQREEDYLVSVATIAERKNSLLLAEAAKLAKTPVVFLGKPHFPDDPYFRRFQSVVDNQFVRYPGFVPAEEKHRYLRGARGFALLSRFESGCIALYEGAAAGLPLFLPDLPWATKVYREAKAVRFVRLGPASSVAPALQQFHQSSHRLNGQTFPIFSWREIAEKYRAVYQSVLSRGTNRLTASS